MRQRTFISATGSFHRVDRVWSESKDTTPFWRLRSPIRYKGLS